MSCRRKPRTRERSVPTAMIALDRASDGPALDAITGPSLQEMLREDFPGQICDAPLVGKRQAPRKFRDRSPRDVDSFLIRVVLYGQLAADRLKKVMVHGLVDAVPRHREPVVDASERREDAPVNPGLLADFPHR